MTEAELTEDTLNSIEIFEENPLPLLYQSGYDVALRHIEEKGYARPFAADPRKLFKIGVNFSTEKRCIDNWKIGE